MEHTGKPLTLHLFRNNNIQRISSDRLRMDHNATIPDRMVDFLSDASSLPGFVALQKIGQVVRVA